MADHTLSNIKVMLRFASFTVKDITVQCHCKFKKHGRGILTMWKRKEVKARAKASFKKNYWKCLLAALILAVIGGGLSRGMSAGGGGFSTLHGGSIPSYHIDIDDSGLKHGIKSGMDDLKDEIDDFKEDMEDFKEDMEDTREDIREEIRDAGKDGGLRIIWNDEEVTINNKEDLEKLDDFFKSVDEKQVVEASIAFVVVMIVVFFIVSVILLAVGFTLKALLLNPIELGCKRFFRKNLDEPASLGNVMFAFDSHYKNIAKTMFLRDLFTFLWSLLFIIPGIIKSYEYKLIPYLLSENPQMTKNEAFAESKRLMKGNKWRAFVVDLSFIAWDLLTLCTCGIVGIFFVGPYKASTEASLYEAIRYGEAN